MKLLTFLGLGKYNRITYTWRDLAYETEYFPEALARWHQPREMLVLLTAEARAHVNWENLQARLKGIVTPRPVDIPSGRDERELWTIFQTLTQELRGPDEVVFDVTHAFRSLPILALLATAYLRSARAVNLRALVYGAFEAQTEGRAPVFDLTPFLGLLDWITATNLFLTAGNGEPLADLLRDKCAEMDDLATSVTSISQGLRLLRPHHVQQAAAELPARTAAVAARLDTAPPLAALLQTVQAEYSPHGLARPTEPAQARRCLLGQLRLARWYADKGQLVQALSMAREWVPSLLAHEYGLDPLAKQDREQMEMLLSGGVEKRAGAKYVSRFKAAWVADPRSRCIRKLWNQLASLRNDVLHAGFRVNPTPASKVISSVQDILTQLDAIAAEWNLEESTP